MNAALTVAIIGLAILSHIVPGPWNCIALAALTSIALYSVWTRQSAMCRVAHSASEILARELDELIAEARRRAGSSPAD